jgi:hypothetical protein
VSHLGRLTGGLPLLITRCCTSLFEGTPADLVAARLTLTAPRRLRRLDTRLLFPACRFVGWSYRIPKRSRELINRGRATNTRSGTYEDDDM